MLVFNLLMVWKNKIFEIFFVVMLNFNCFDKLFDVIFMVCCVVLDKFDFVKMFDFNWFIEFECICMVFFENCYIIFL